MTLAKNSVSPKLIEIATAFHLTFAELGPNRRESRTWHLPLAGGDVYKSGKIGKRDFVVTQMDTN